MMTHNHNIVGAQLAARIFGRNLRGIGFALAALLLAAPGTALADDECGAQADPGNPETFTCAPGDYASGITYSSDGDLTLQVTDDSDHLDVFETGVGVTGNGGDNVFWDSSTFVDNDIRGSGIVLDYASDTGDIGVDVGGEIVTQSGATHGIRAISNSGDVSITTGGPIGRFSQYGIQAETGGSGTLDIIVGESIGIATIAAIDAITGTGLLTIDIVSTGSFDSVNGGSGNAIRTNAGGDVEINVGAGRQVTSSFTSGESILDITATGEATLNNAGGIGGNQMAIRASGGALTVNNDGKIGGTVDFSSLNDGYTFNNNAGATWTARGFATAGGVLFGDGKSDLGAGTFNNAGTIEIGGGDYISAPGTTFTGMGDSVLRLNNARLNGPGQLDCSAPSLTGCLDLSGGATAGQTEVLVVTSVSAPSGPPFLKELDTPVNPGIVVVDVGGGTSAADHFVLSPNSIAHFDPEPGTSGNPIVDIPIYAEDPVYGAILETGGLFDYALLYNPDTQQHLLSSVPNPQGLEYAVLIHESLSVWHTTADAVAGRQADLRDGGERGGWVRVFTDQTERDFKPSVTTHGNTFNYDRSYDLDTRGVIAGYDLTADDSHVFGVHLGFVGMRLDHDDSPTNDEAEFLSGASSTFGVYAGWWNETGLTLDGTLNVNLLDIQHDVRDGLEDTRTNVISVGVRAEAGWRFPLAESFYVQPLATAAYVTADVERLDMRDYDAKFEDEQSQRAALGVRLGGGTDLSNDRFSRVKYWLTARVWEEYAEDGNVQFLTDGDPLVIEDDISEGFEEVGLGVSVTSPDENLEVFLSGNVRSGDHTDGNNVTIGARMNW